MADNPAKKKQFDDWQNQAFSARLERAALERRKELWQALAKFIHANGAFVVSLPNVPRIRIETRRGSSLVSKLAELGYSPRHCGVGTRLTAGNTPETIFQSLDIIEIRLPG
jgi:hypothetical protein